MTASRPPGKMLDVSIESEQRFTELSLFPEDREVPHDSLNSIQIKLDQTELHRPRAWGNCWLGCDLWRELRLDEFWSERLPAKREVVA